MHLGDFHVGGNVLRSNINFGQFFLYQQHSNDYEGGLESSYHRLTKKELCHSNETWHAFNSTFPDTHCVASFQINPLWISKVSARDMQWLLMPDHKHTRLVMSQVNLALFEADLADLEHFLTQDECWVHHFEPGPNDNPCSGITPLSPPPPPQRRPR